MQVKTIRIVSLSAGTLGEDFVRHELEIGLQRLRAWGVQVQFGAHALRGRDYIAAHPEARAADLCDPLCNRWGRYLPASALSLQP